MNKIGNMKGKNVLFLQGPMGNFFKKLDIVLRKHGAKTYKIGFNAGDWYFSNKDNYTAFREEREKWKPYLEMFLKEKRIDIIFLFGDCRYYQSQAIKLCSSMGIDIYVFEEGYIRPHYITMEKFGVNDHSRISRDADFYNNLPSVDVESPLHARQSKFKMIYSATVYYSLSNLLKFQYPHYQHHRDFSALNEAYYGLRGLLRKGIYAVTEKKYYRTIQIELSKKYFFVPLQTYNDFQILQHSHYGSLEKFIVEVLESFSKFAHKKDYLIFKHHPVDRGRKNYIAFIMKHAKRLQIDHRVLVFHDVHLPTCLKHAKGTVTINSTVGLSAIGHGIPTLTLGHAIYDIEGLTCKGMKLEEFWNVMRNPDMELYERFKSYLIETTQLNGSYYGLFPPSLDTNEMFGSDR